ncbi:type II secretion system protein GspL [Serratia entomophila]|uniref:type II secretion system protein GspL n=1 Tax=Serratia entomophila TaxID=42906 RepID=UPI00217771DA|nr:type II secretion system protein GspL [Serratia entomophila]CAI0969924.1 Cholera toxin secretion protein epsL [Serratia entomophila]CAI1759780.1 Cholera toxin secretion protein epsL [Serratia entomophila]CAI1813318.1 Cholera toxin secretion protein epsL [Serratia entomophila]CAI1877027.1 Cholera toxin secretion protein epsL [Serratia entomophila]CAI1893610.1 Cholera toxin secretion protein epsL [Serratia entomophila]
MSDNMLLIALGHDAMAEVRWGKAGAAHSAFSARVDLSGGGEELAVMACNSRVVVLVPARHVVLREGVFQGKSRQMTPMALAYQHESELLADVEQMHWVLLGKEQQRYGIAGVALAQMAAWCELLNACGLRADKMLPDVLALPLPGRCSALQAGDRWLIRSGPWRGMALPHAWAATAPPVTPDLCLHADADVLPGWENASRVEDPLWLLTDEAWRSKSNLLQGKFRPAASWPRFMPGKTACALMLASCSLLACGLYHQLMAGQFERQAAAVTQRLLPGLPPGVSAAEAASRQVRQMQNIINEPQLFTLLPYASEALSLWEQPQLQSLTFDGAKNELTITLFKEQVTLPPPSEDSGIHISMTQGAAPDVAILRVGGEQ